MKAEWAPQLTSCRHLQGHRHLHSMLVNLYRGISFSIPTDMVSHGGLRAEVVWSAIAKDAETDVAIDSERYGLDNRRRNSRDE